ncbi:Protein of unknown function [Selenomonas sp. GACV-9]|uniref:DUF3298 and DUF4163 domain-containing protein n=1 Tax=Selenomonas sp. GACV-9 TaxID=3158782 RepID=UPI0008E4A247|nr:Protein of unknown function [Selenomonas ruminantium]
MRKKLMVAGIAAGLLTVLGPGSVDTPWQATASACEEGAAEERIPFSMPLAYSSDVVTKQLYHEQDGRLLIEAKTFSVTLSGKYMGYYPQLQQTLKRISKENRRHLSKVLRSWRQDLDETYELRRHDYALHKDEVPFTYEESYSGLRADSHVFSFACSEYSYLGGAHPVLYYKAVTIDTRTGTILKLADVLQHTDGFAAVIADEAIAQQEYRGQLPERDEAIRLIEQMIGDDSLVFGLDDDGMKVYFGNYALGTYAMGTMVVNVPYGAHGDYFRPKYIFEGIRAKG